MSEENGFQEENRIPREGKESNGEEPKNKIEAPKSRVDFYVELALFLVLGILVGISLKTEAVKKLTVGYNDYKMKIMKQDYNINQFQKDLIEKEREATSQSAETEGNNVLPN